MSLCLLAGFVDVAGHRVGRTAALLAVSWFPITYEDIPKQNPNQSVVYEQQTFLGPGVCVCAEHQCVVKQEQGLPVGFLCRADKRAALSSP